MDRVNVTTRNDDGELELVGHFDLDKAEVFPEAKAWDGQNNVSVMTGSNTEHEQLLRTAGGRWVLNSWSSRSVNGFIPRESHTFVIDERARGWLLLNDHLDVVKQYWGEQPEEAGPDQL